MVPVSSLLDHINDQVGLASSWYSDCEKGWFDDILQDGYMVVEIRSEVGRLEWRLLCKGILVGYSPRSDVDIQNNRLAFAFRH